ncbi:MAG: hypothetical protein ABIJ12_09475, partial [bacterium]
MEAINSITVLVITAIIFIIIYFYLFFYLSKRNEKQPIKTTDDSEKWRIVENPNSTLLLKGGELRIRSYKDLVEKIEWHIRNDSSRYNNIEVVCSNTLATTQELFDKYSRDDKEFY